MSRPTPPAGPTARDITVDVLVVGSGTGMAAALRAAELGLRALVIEKTAWVGGSTALSGGAFWIPANPVLQEDGSGDTAQQATDYLEAIVGPSAPRERREAFVSHGPAAVAMLQRLTPLEFFWAKGYADYHPENPGGSAVGRTCESKPFDVNRLGEEAGRLRVGDLAAPVPMPVTGADYKWMNLMMRKPMVAWPRILKRVAQGIGGLALKRDYAAGGKALAAGLFAGLAKARVPVWTRTELTDVIIEDGAVVGVRAEQDGTSVRIGARLAVVLAAGGFDHDLPMRHEHQSASLQAGWSHGAEGNTGDAIKLARTRVDAGIGLMQEAWWFPSIAPLREGETPGILLAERSLPGSFMVNSAGERFANESEDYMSFGQRCLAMEAAGTSMREMWLVFDQDYRNRYMFGTSLFPRMPLPQEWFDAGIAVQGDDPRALAAAAGLPEGTFAEAFARFNELAASGDDGDFGRGRSAYDRYYGDPTVSPNPNLRPLGGHLYAVKVVLADLGTCGGLVADERARVLTGAGEPVPGLYAIGNTAANAFGHRYPGAGATIGQGLVFGYIAANDAAGRRP